MRPVRQVLCHAGLLGLVTGLGFFALPTLAQTSVDMEKAIENLPGAEISGRTQTDGSEKKDIRLPSGVRFLVTHAKDGGVNVMAMDESGHGAVMCIWSIYITLSASLDVCDPATEPTAKAALSHAIEQIDAFIIKNSLTPTSQADLDARKAQEKSKALAATSGLSRETIIAKCRASDLGPLFAAIKSMPEGKLQTDIDRLLSVPRPPVMNPCL